MGLLQFMGGQRQLLAQAAQLRLQLLLQGSQLLAPQGQVASQQFLLLIIAGHLPGLLGQLPMFRRDDAPPVGKLRIEGDAELARRLQQLAQRFDPDWQQPFVRVFGEVLGVQVAKAVSAGLKQAQVVGRNLAESAAEYVTEESRDVVPRAELDAFHDDVDALRDDVERIGAKIARLRRERGVAP